MYGKAAPQFYATSSSIAQSDGDSSPSPPQRPRQPHPRPRQPPQAELVGCVTQSRDEVKASVCSNAGVLLSSGRGFDTCALGRQYFLEPGIQVGGAVWLKVHRIHDSFAALSLLIIIHCRHSVPFHQPYGNCGVLILHGP